MAATHSHTRTGERRALLWVLAITSAMFAAEVAGGLLSHSLALLADAGHMLTDLAAIGLALLAFWYAGRPANATRTYGYVRAEVLGGFLNGLALLLISVYIAFEGARRIARTPEVDGVLVLAVGAAGLVVNVVAALMLRRTGSTNLNLRGVFLHLVGDGLSSLAVLASAGIIILTGWNLVDPMIALFIALVIIFGAGRLVLSTVNILMEAVPAGVDLESVRASILATPAVASVHDLHVWTLTSGCVAMSAHLRQSETAPQEDSSALLVALRGQLKTLHGIDHLTLQIEGASVPDEEIHCTGDPRCLA